MRDVARNAKATEKTILRLVRETGGACRELLESLRDFETDYIQVDEMWTYVGLKDKTLSRLELKRAGVGTYWCFTAVCGRSKFLLAYHFGKRTRHQARIFFQKLSQLLPEKVFTSRVPILSLITDGWRGYRVAGEDVFGNSINRGMLVKQYSALDEKGETTPASRWVGELREVLAGSLPASQIHTAYAERTYLTFRQKNNRISRATAGFSKKLSHHELHFAMQIVFYNFCTELSPVPPPAGSEDRSWRKRSTPAVEAGVADEVWDAKALVALTDDYLSRQRKLSSEEIIDPAPIHVDANGLPFWVYWNDSQQKAKVHQASCTNCNHGTGKFSGGTSGKPQVGQWIGFPTKEEAQARAAELEPYSYSLCKMCIGTPTFHGSRVYRRNRG